MGKERFVPCGIPVEWKMGSRGSYSGGLRRQSLEIREEPPLDPPREHPYNLYRNGRSEASSSAWPRRQSPEIREEPSLDPSREHPYNLYRNGRSEQRCRGTRHEWEEDWSGDGGYEQGSDWGDFDLEARFRRWECKVLESTDAFASIMLSVLSLLTQFYIQRLPAPSEHSVTICRVLAGLALAHLYILRFHRNIYRRHRGLILILLRSGVNIICLLIWAFTRDPKKPMSKSMLVATRLIFGVFTTVGWQLTERATAVLQGIFFIIMRVVMAFVKSRAGEFWHCSPLAVCNPTVILISGVGEQPKHSEVKSAMASTKKLFSYTLAGLFFDLFFLVVLPTAVLWIKRSHSVLLFNMEIEDELDDFFPEDAAGGGARGGRSVQTRGLTASSHHQDPGANSDDFPSVPVLGVVRRVWNSYRRTFPLMTFADPETERKFNRWYRKQSMPLDLGNGLVSVMIDLLFLRKAWQEWGLDYERSRVHAIASFIQHLLHVSCALSNSTQYVKYRTFIIVTTRCLSTLSFYAVHRQVMLKNYEAALTFYKAYPEKMPVEYTWSTMEQNATSSVTGTEVSLTSEGVKMGYTSYRKWPNALFCMAAEELKLPGDMTFELQMVLLALICLGCHLPMHATLALQGAYTAGLFSMWCLQHVESPLPADCRGVSGFFFNFGAVSFQSYSDEYFLFFCPLMTVIFSWIFERSYREVFKSTMRTEERERMREGFLASRGAGGIVDGNSLASESREIRWRGVEGAAGESPGTAGASSSRGGGDAARRVRRGGASTSGGVGAERERHRYPD